jgi:hypothetical protein
MTLTIPVMKKIKKKILVLWISREIASIAITNLIKLKNTKEMSLQMKKDSNTY